MKLFRKILLTFVFFLTISIISIGILAYNINPDTIKSLINKKITLLTKKNSTIDGTVSWILYPRPGLKFTKISIGDPLNKEDYFISIDNLTLKLKLSPLLQGEFLFSQINIDGLKMQINPNKVKTTKSEPEVQKLNLKTIMIK